MSWNKANKVKLTSNGLVNHVLYYLAFHFEVVLV